MTTTWVEGAAGSLFDVDNLPYGVFSLAGEEPRVGARIGDFVLDLAPVAAKRSSTSSSCRTPTRRGPPSTEKTP